MFINLKLDKNTEIYINSDNVDSIIHYVDAQSVHVKYKDKTMIYNYSEKQAAHNGFVLRGLVK